MEAEKRGELKVVRSTVWSAGAGCHGGCGVDLNVRDGKPVKVEGITDHSQDLGTLCPRVLVLKHNVHSPLRLEDLMIRKGRAETIPGGRPPGTRQSRC